MVIRISVIYIFINASYNLTYDCDNLVDTCKLELGSNSCNEQYETCINNQTTSCDTQTSDFNDWIPTFSKWIGDLFNSICNASDVLCVAWRTVCESSGDACDLLGDACQEGISDDLLECLWENNEGYPIKRQLEDGIRFLDLDACQVGNESVVFCHGEGLTRALGTDLDSIFSDIKKFMEDNPNEILNIAFGDTRKDWVYSIDSYFVVSYTYTAGDLTAEQLNASFTEWSNNASIVIADDLINYGYIRWQTIDITVGLNSTALEDAIINNDNPGKLCLKDLANKINYDLLDYIYDIFKDKFPYIIRVTLDYYNQSNLFDVVNKLNQLNVQKNITI
ncbi:446_t:CDS:2 [Diversispora eburnea]|uniref:446_t:CDS:1 n=1 Tax=Diversispora eburnea TaxID=1213867 RepID=A0A9N8ZE55_9GLOM|nr:446_t:CDS:2 [Diversispora eburnea]